MHLCIRTRAISSLKSSPQVSQQKIYNFKLGSTLPAGGNISNAQHMHLSNRILELVNIRGIYKLLLCVKGIFFSFFNCDSKILKRMVSVLLKECKH